MLSANPLVPTNAGSLIEARGLHFAYRADLWVVQDVSLQLERGTLAALIGANGSGKSTLIRLLAGLRPPSSGEIVFGGQPLKGISRKRLARSLAYVPQINPMIFPFTAIEVVLTGRSPYTPRFRFENRFDVEKALEALATVDGAHLAPRPVTELSGGERQLVAVARALAQEPECLILDEPAAALGPEAPGRAHPHPAAASGSGGDDDAGGDPRPAAPGSCLRSDLCHPQGIAPGRRPPQAGPDGRGALPGLRGLPGPGPPVGGAHLCLVRHLTP